ncbi:thioesterase family protein [Alkalicoccus daliensis]|uniref:Acyl-CoA thioester hydrolase n=1 Tax=Alkalicoccus daliensis TaxID=745820 RepID=A0A1H0J066_9BACI|nr:thioesterase family protein [Alkalicoccus daliensis]SDO36829.1 acyl-CoA thioester hydrolase [Alkalicoccus daliensis]
MITGSYESIVEKSKVDFNNHMNDAVYAKEFSNAMESMMDQIALDETGRNEKDYTIFTLESHILYTKEMKVGESIYIEFYLLDYDSKRIHAFFEMKNNLGEITASCEMMLLGVSASSRKAAVLPIEVENKVKELLISKDEWPEKAGRSISMTNKK